MKRILTSKPSELLNMTGREILQAIKMSEGRVLRVAARIRGPYLIDGTCNAEVAAAFGADIINLDTYDLLDPYIPGWPSKNSEDDIGTENIQIPMGRGYSFKEMEGIVGRPISVLLLVADSDFGEEKTKQFYGNIVATEETFKKSREEGVRMIQVDSLSDGINQNFIDTIKNIRKIVGNDMVIHVARSHGPGILNMENTQNSLIEEQDVIDLINAGVDIVGFPVPGSYPGWDIAKTKKYVDIVHANGALAVLGVHTSQEGSNPQILEQLALNAKMCGADMHDLGDCGFTECMIDPENIMRYGIAIRGKRHHYRRMSISGRR